MRYVHIDRVELGAVLARDVWNTHGQILFHKGSKINQAGLNQMHRLGIHFVFLESFEMNEITIKLLDLYVPISDRMRDHLLHLWLQAMQATKHHHVLDGEAIYEELRLLIKELSHHRGWLFQAFEIRTAENNEFLHALYVTIVSIMVGLHMELPYSQLLHLAVGAFLHDIGKVDPARNDRLPANEFHHTWLGFAKIKNEPKFGAVAAHVALEHHEWVDGTGFPRGLKAEEISQLARIVAIANRFDHYFLVGEPFADWEIISLPHDAYGHMLAKVGHELDHDAFVAFMHSVAVYPTGIRVMLNHGDHGYVLRQNAHLPSRPIVSMMNSNVIIDLAHDPRRFIVEVIP